MREGVDQRYEVYTKQDDASLQYKAPPPRACQNFCVASVVSTTIATEHTRFRHGRSRYGGRLGAARVEANADADEATQCPS